MSRHASLNRVYRLVWSQASRAWVPVAETARGKGKSGRSVAKADRSVLAAAISLALAPLAQAGPAASPCVANTCVTAAAIGSTSHPTGAQVISGAASITQRGNTTDIRQSSADVSIDWQSFNVGSQATVDFIQPSASSVAVNRILGNTMATGTLSETSLAGNITQVASTAVNVTGASSLTADNGLTATSEQRYAITLTAAGAMTVSGTVGATLTTTTTGTGHATTFGNTKVGTSLAVTSTGAVTEASGDELLVNGAGTDSSDPVNNVVTVNGVIGAQIN